MRSDSLFISSLPRGASLSCRIVRIDKKEESKDEQAHINERKINAMVYFDLSRNGIF